MVKIDQDKAFKLYNKLVNKLEKLVPNIFLYFNDEVEGIKEELRKLGVYEDEK